MQLEWCLSGSRDPRFRGMSRGRLMGSGPLKRGVPCCVRVNEAWLKMGGQQ